MRPPVIVDTNIVVAGLLTQNPESPVAAILDAMLSAAIPFALSEALLAEYRDVLGRPQLRRLHRLTFDEIDLILTDIALHATVLAPPAGPSAPDPGDQMLWDLLASRTDMRLITGDAALLADPVMAGRVISARDFIDTDRSGR